MTEALERVPAAEHPATSYEMSVDQVLAQVQKIQKIMSEAMQEDTHFGTIPGTPKATLYKPGAEKLCLTFRLDPQYEVLPNSIQRDDLISYSIRCTLYHIITGDRIASGMGSCNSREAKYRWRYSNRVCPECGEEAIIKGKEEYGGGWICFMKKGGCGAKWEDGAEEIESQKIGKVENDNPWDLDNTLFKMACKRALIAAVLNGTAASDIFTQGDFEPHQDDDQVTTQKRDQSSSSSPSGSGVPKLNEQQLDHLNKVIKIGKVSDEQVGRILGIFSCETKEEVKQSDLKKVLDEIEAIAKLNQKREEAEVKES